ncbi:MAG: argininosuccinate lyase [Saccharofermentanales bacterium]
MSKKMWDGRFSKETDKLVNDYNSSISFDCRMYRQDIRGSIAHAAMLAYRGIIPQTDSDQIISGLIDIEHEIDSGMLQFDPGAEDIHMFIESKLTERIGDAGKRLHTGRSRNDQVALDLKLYLRDETAQLGSLLSNLCNAILGIASDHIETIMPGYTHLQRAQPVTFAHHLMAYVQMFLRDLSRLEDCTARMNTMPLGSGALAGTTYPLDREMVTFSLQFSKPTDNSIDGVSDRDFVIELAAVLAIIMVHISRLSEEIILWSSSEFGFIELDDAFSTGSSIMPQKKNPDVAELSRGKSGRVFGSLMTILTVMKGLPLAYNKDMQEDKEAIFDSLDTVKSCLPAFTGMMGTLAVKKERMLEAAAGGFTNATDLADYLVKKGIPFRESHEISGKLVGYCISRNITLDDLSIDEYKKYSSLIEDDIYESISLDRCVNGRKVWGGPAFATVRQAIENAYLELGKYSSRLG